jgi:hypothetical protein
MQLSGRGAQLMRPALLPPLESLERTGGWDAYTVVAVEYFLGRDEAAGEPALTLSNGIGKITLNVESSNKISPGHHPGE